MRIFLTIVLIIGFICLVVGVYFSTQHGKPSSVAIVPPTIKVETTLIMPLQNKSQVEQFMLSDTTDQHPYTDDYKCGSFAQDVVTNATSVGIKANYIIVKWSGSYIVHAIVLFPTVEDGNVYVDATQGDWWVNFESGENNYYSYLMTNSSRYGFYNKTLEMYGVKDSEGNIEWIAPKIPVAPITDIIPTPTLAPTPEPTPEPAPVVCPRPLSTEPAWGCSNSWLLKPDGSSVSFCRYGTPMPLQNKEEVEQFMRWDTTDQNLYIDGQYVCANFVEDVCRNASLHDIAIGTVFIDFVEGYNHGIVVFPTVEDGDIYVDVTSGDWWATVVEGEIYRAVSFDDPSKLYFYSEKVIDHFMTYC